MDDKDFKRIEHMVTNVVESKLCQFQKDIRQANNDDLQQFRKDIRQEINEDFKHHVGIFTEDFQHKLQIVAEGHQMLSEKLDRVKTDLEDKIERIEIKVDVVAADIAAHRVDTEGHKKGYDIW